MTQAVKAVIDASWIPENLRGKASWFGLYDFWNYEDEKGNLRTVRVIIVTKKFQEVYRSLENE